MQRTFLIIFFSFSFSRYFCDKCQRFEYICGEYPKPADVKASHECDKVKCRFCHTKRPKDSRIRHHCPIARPEFTKKIPKVGVWHIELTDESQSNCGDCIYTAEEIVNCKLHQRLKHPASKSIMSTVYLEVVERGKFLKLRAFAGHEGDMPVSDAFVYNEYPDILKTPLDDAPNPVRYKSPPTKKAVERFKWKGNHNGNYETKMTAIEKTLHDIITENLSNLCLVMLGHRSLVAVLNALLNNGMEPLSYKSKDGKLTMLTIPGVDIRIVEASHFLGASNVQKLAARNGLDPPATLFPRKMRRKKYCSSQEAQSCPTIDMFLDFFDTTEDRKMKEAFVASFEGQWHFWNELKKSADEECKIILTSLCQYIHFAYNLQSDLLKLPNSLPVQPKEDELVYTHPFSKGISTNTSFLFRLYKVLLMPAHSLYAIDKEAKGLIQQSSKVEDEFVQSMMLSHPHTTDIWTAYHSADGQRRFKGIIPDMYCGTCKHAW